MQFVSLPLWNKTTFIYCDRIVLTFSSCFQSQEYGFSLNIMTFHLSTYWLYKRTMHHLVCCQSILINLRVLLSSSLLKPQFSFLASLTQVGTCQTLQMLFFPALKKNRGTFTKIPASTFCFPDYVLFSVWMKKGLRHRSRELESGGAFLWSCSLPLLSPQEWRKSQVLTRREGRCSWMSWMWVIC